MARQITCALFCLLASAGSAAIAQELPGQVHRSQKINGVQGNLGVSLEGLANFGRACAPVGDFDADGVPDILVGAPRQFAAGAAYLLRLNTDGTVKAHSQVVVGGLDSLDNYGRSVAGLGDLDGDGTPDVAVGAPLDDGGLSDGSDVGAVHVVFLKPTGAKKSSAKIGKDSGGWSAPLGSFDHFGSSVASLGDLDGDGVAEIAVGADGDGDGGFAAGAVYVLFLHADGSVKSWTKISASSGGLTNVPTTNWNFGNSVAAIGDFDGDGVTELAVGGLNVPGAPGTPAGGSVWVVFLNADGSVKHDLRIGAGLGGFTGELHAIDGFGFDVEPLGDLDGDGVTDLCVGAHKDDDGGLNAGAIWILFLNRDGTVRAQRKVDSTIGGFVGSGPLERFGGSLASPGDVDGDGVTDLVVGEFDDNEAVSLSGAVWTLFLDGGLWTDLGGALPGTAGAPQLVATGRLDGDTELGLSLNTCAPSAPALAFLAGPPAALPFKGGVLLATSVHVLVPLVTDAAGQLQLYGKLPPGLPTGTTLVVQAIVADAGAPHGVAITNAVMAVTP